MSARILIVEDEEPLTLLLRYNLEAEGYEIHFRNVKLKKIEGTAGSSTIPPR